MPVQWGGEGGWYKRLGSKETLTHQHPDNECRDTDTKHINKQETCIGQLGSNNTPKSGSGNKP